MTVVDARRYSRNSGATSEESETGTPGSSSREDLADAPLVLAVDVGVEEADRDRLDALAPQDRGCVAHGVVLERPQHLALGPSRSRTTKARSRGTSGFGFSNCVS